MSRFPFAFAFPFAVLVTSSLLACSSEESKGAAPTIRDFTLAPTTVEAGKATILEGEVTVEDADGDIAGLSARLMLPDGTAKDLQPNDVAAGSATTAPIKLQAQLALPPGDYTLLVWARDRAGNESAKLQQALTAK